MQVKVTGHPKVTPSPVVTVPVNPPPVVSLPPVIPPANTAGTRLISSMQVGNALNLTPASANVLQCAVYVPEFEQWFSTQATIGTNGSREPYENVVLSRMTATGSLISSMILNNAGHGTSIGVEVIGSTPYILMSYKFPASGGAEFDNVRFPYSSGTFNRNQISGLSVMPKLDAGYNTIAFDWASDFMVVRTTPNNRDIYVRRRISEWRAGTDVKYGQINLTQLPPTLQGFCTLNDTLFRYIGAPNGERLIPADPTLLQQYNWNSGARIDQVDYTNLGKTSLGVYPGDLHEPESCTMYRENDGTATLAFSVTLGKPGSHTWKMYRLTKIGSAV